MENGEVERSCFNAVNAILNNNRICYGCSHDAELLIKEIFSTANQNPTWNKFPDFICDNGFIEHFEVTSSYSNRNGSTMKRELDCLKKEVKTKDEALKAEVEVTPCYEGKTITTDTWHSDHSYDYFCISFKRAWDNHIEKYDKYNGDKSKSVFMIQYNDSALVTGAVLPDIKTGIYYGELLKQPDYNGYRLIYDNELLEYIYQYKDKIRYVAFFNNDWFHGKKCDIICVEIIPEILKIVKGKYMFHCAKVGTSCTTHVISIPNSIIEGNDSNDQS